MNSLACFYNPKKLSYVDLILTNCPKLFFNTQMLDAWLWGFYILMQTFCKILHEKPSSIFVISRLLHRFSPINKDILW